MNRLDTRKYEMLARAREFGSTHPTLFPAGSRPAELLGELAAAVDALSTQASTQQVGAGVARQAGTNRSAVRGRVLASLERLRMTARELAGDVPGVERRFELPRARRDQAVLGTARTFLENAEPLRPLFERHLLGPEFFDRLEADVAAFEEALSAQRRGRETRVAATAAIAGELDRGLKAVRSLDTLMKNRGDVDRSTLAQWRSATRIHSPNVRGAAAPVMAVPEEPPTEVTA